MSFAVCVYCGSRAGNHASYEQVASTLGTALARHGWQLVYGGGSIGLMGVLARHVLAAGGHVIGIIPQALLEAEVGLVEASELVVPLTLRERKAIMDERSQAFVVLPGGYGTFEEMLEAITLRQLGYHNKPIIIVNLNGYFDPLLAFFAHAAEEGFIWSRQERLYDVVGTPEEAIALLEAHVAQDVAQQ